MNKEPKDLIVGLDIGTAKVVAMVAELLPDGSSGPNLEYSNEFLELQSAATGREENQFQPAEEPDWKQVQRLSEGLLSRTRDLRVLVFWLNAQLQLRGLSGLLPALALMRHWCQHHWVGLNPPLDDQDPFERINAMEALSQGEAFLSALKRTEVISLPMMGAVQVRQTAGLLLKNNIRTHFGGIAEDFRAFIKVRPSCAVLRCAVLLPLPWAMCLPDPCQALNQLANHTALNPAGGAAAGAGPCVAPAAPHRRHVRRHDCEPNWAGRLAGAGGRTCHQAAVGLLPFGGDAPVHPVVGVENGRRHRVALDRFGPVHLQHVDDVAGL